MEREFLRVRMLMEKSRDFAEAATCGKYWQDRKESISNVFLDTFPLRHFLWMAAIKIYFFFPQLFWIPDYCCLNMKLCAQGVMRWLAGLCMNDTFYKPCCFLVRGENWSQTTSQSLNVLNLLVMLPLATSFIIHNKLFKLVLEDWNSGSTQRSMTHRCKEWWVHSSVAPFDFLFFHVLWLTHPHLSSVS